MLAAVVNGQQNLAVMFGGLKPEARKEFAPSDFMPDFQKPKEESIEVPSDYARKQAELFAEVRAEQARLRKSKRK